MKFPSRLHRSSLVAAICFFALAILVCVPGTRIGSDYGNGGEAWAGYEHGWPFRYLDRVIVNENYRDRYPGPNTPTGEEMFQILDRNWFATHVNASDTGNQKLLPEWMTFTAWPFRGQFSAINSTALVIDICILVLLIAIGTLLVEWRQRKRTRFFQFTLGEFLVGMLLVSAFVGVVIQSRQRYQNDWNSMCRIEAIDNGSLWPSFSPSLEFVASQLFRPTWARKLSGPWWDQCMSRCKSITCHAVDYYAPIPTEVSPEISAKIDSVSRETPKLDAIENLRIGIDFECDACQHLIDHLEISSRIRKLEFVCENDFLQDPTIYALNGLSLSPCRKLESITFDWLDFENRTEWSKFRADVERFLVDSPATMICFKESGTVTRELLDDLQSLDCRVIEFRNCSVAPGVMAESSKLSQQSPRFVFTDCVEGD